MPNKLNCFVFTLIALCLQLSSFGASRFQQADQSGNRDENQTPRNTEKKTAGFLDPQKSLESLRLPEGFHAELFAAEPEVRQPIAATTDSRGRLWVCENYTYSESKVNFDLSLSDQVLIFEDTDHDGRADSRKVFWDKGKRLTGIALGFDGVYVACAPQLLFIPDRNHDDKPDGPPEVLLDGWNDDAVRHNIVNGLMWGPDGWLYGRHGIMATSFVGKPGASDSQRTPINCGIWRYHPLHKNFEVVAEGTTNPWGMDFNNEGDLFMINTVIGHLWHVVPGARYDRMYGSHFNPYTYQTIKQTADHYHWNKSGGESWHDTKKIGVTTETDRFGGGHAHCGLLYYGDQSWPEKYRDTVLTCNLHGLRINNDRLKPKGNGYVALHSSDFANTTDTWFRGIELVRSHDQGFYLLDWQDTGECHENDGVHRTSGRIYKVTYGDRKVPSPDFSTTALKRILVELLKKDRWHFQQASMELRRRLANAKLDKTVDQLLQLIVDQEDASPQMSLLRTMLASDWGTARVYRKRLDEQFADLGSKENLTIEDNRMIRELLKVAANEHQLRETPTQAIARRLPILCRAVSPATRLTIASTLNRLAPKDRFNVAANLVGIANDKEDNIQPLLIWYAIEPLVCEYPSYASQIAFMSEMPQVTTLISRRMAEEIHRKKVAKAILRLLETAPKPKRVDVLDGIAQALQGRKKLEPPENWDSTLGKLDLSVKEKELVSKIQVVFGDGQTLDELRRIAGDRSADPRMRGQAFLTLAENKAEKLTDLLNSHFGDRDVRRYVIQAYAYCEGPQVAQRLINQYQQLKPAGKKAAINTLTNKIDWANRLLVAIEQGKIPKSHVTAWHARQMGDMNDKKLAQKLEEVWGAIRQTPEQKLNEIAAVNRLMRDVGSSDSLMSNGEKLFAKNCANCHVLYGKGKQVGPDLTGSNRKDLSYLLENILDPSSSVADTFRTSIIALEDGRSITGVVLKQTDTILEVQTAENIVVIDRSDIENLKKTDKSLMPEGLLNDYTDEQKQALLVYLMNR